MGVALGTEGTHPRRAPCGGWPRGQRPRSEAGPRVSGGFARAAAPSTTSCLARCQGPQEGARRPRAPLAPQCCSEALRGGPQSDLPGEKGLGLRADPTPAVHTGRGWCPGLRGLGRDGVVARSPPIEKTPLQVDVRSPPPPQAAPSRAGETAAAGRRGQRSPGPGLRCCPPAAGPSAPGPEGAWVAAVCTPGHPRNPRPPGSGPRARFGLAHLPSSSALGATSPGPEPGAGADGDGGWLWREPGAGEAAFSGARKGPRPGTGRMLESEDPVPLGGLAVPTGRRGLGAVGWATLGARAAVCLCHSCLPPPLSGCPSLSSGLITSSGHGVAGPGLAPIRRHCLAVPRPAPEGTLMEEGRGRGRRCHHPAPPADARGTHRTLRTSVREPNLETKAGR